MHAMKAHEEMVSELHSFLTSVLNGGQFSASRPLNTGVLIILSPTRKETSYSDQNLTFSSHSKKIQKVVP